MEEIKRYCFPKFLLHIQVFFILVVVAVGGYFMYFKGTQLHNPSIITAIGIIVILVYLNWDKAYVLLHESCHKKMAISLGYEAEYNLKEKYCYINGYITPRHFRLIALSPFVVEAGMVLLLLLSSAFLTSALYIPTVLLALTTLCGDSGDLYMVIVTMGQPEVARYKINKEDKSFSLWIGME